MAANADFVNEAGGVRLDAALFSHLPASTMAFVREAIAAGRVHVDGRVLRKGARLRGGERILARDVAEAADNRVLPDAEISAEPVYVDASLLAFDKPAGMPVHPLSRGETGTLANGVAARFPECAAVGDSPLAAGAIHRIDAGTSGLVLFARTPEAFASLRSQFAARAVLKRYLALVEGQVESGATLENDLAHDPGVPFCRMIDAHRNRLCESERRRLRAFHAETTFEPLETVRFGQAEATLLSVSIRTGVTHQIRAQLALAGIHIVNDTLYGAFAVEGCGRHFLHSLSAAFRHPETGAETEISVPPPDWARRRQARCG